MHYTEVFSFCVVSLAQNKKNNESVALYTVIQAKSLLMVPFSDLGASFSSCKMDCCGGSSMPHCRVRIH